VSDGRSAQYVRLVVHYDYVSFSAQPGAAIGAPSGRRLSHRGSGWQGVALEDLLGAHERLILRWLPLKSSSVV
jgi:hypothetical protein